jgi:ATP-dependent RNA helicase DeaD
VAEAVHSYGKGLGVRVLPVYGGQDIGQQLRRLKQGIDVVVATPGRALDHLHRQTLKLGRVGMVVLDEADEMLDMGFAEDLEALLGALPQARQTALFSATLPPRIAGIAERHLRNPVRVQIAPERPVSGELPKVRQTAYIVPRAYKDAALGRVLDLEAPTRCLIFCRTRNEVDTLTETLNGHGFRADALHGGLSQEQRDRVMKKFKSHATELLVATDVAARGLDIEKLSHVVNYDLPSAPEAYVHRIGRTGRAGREGVAITLAEPREHRFLRNLERLTKQRIEIATVPTVADLRARRLELTRASVREALVAGELDSYRVVVESLAAEFDPMEVAAAAVKLLHAASGEPGEAEEPEIPAFVPMAPERPGAKERTGGKKPARGERPQRGAPTGPAGRGPKRRAGPAGELAKVFVGAGRNAGMRPADLVGAIANEAGVESKRIGAIEIADAYSLVEVPADVAQQVIQALRGTTLRGRKVTVKRNRG